MNLYKVVCRSTGLKGKDWAKGGYNNSFNQGKSCLRSIREFTGPDIKLICIVCKKGVQLKNKRCEGCLKK